MIVVLKFIPSGMVDPVKLRQTVATLVQAAITGGTLLSAGDSGAITLSHWSNDDMADAK